MHADSTHCAKCARVWIVPDHGAAMDPQPESVLTMQSQQDASMLHHCNDRSNSEWFTKDNSFDKLCLMVDRKWSSRGVIQLCSGQNGPAHFAHELHSRLLFRRPEQSRLCQHSSHFFPEHADTVQDGSYFATNFDIVQESPHGTRPLDC